MELLRMASASAGPFYSVECCSSRSVRRSVTWNPRNRALHLPSSLKIKIAIRKSKGVLCPLLHSSRNTLPPSAASATEMASKEKGTQVETPSMKLLFVEMGVGYDQHGQDITAAAMRACRDAISSNSIPAFRSGSIPGVNSDQMKLQIKIGVPHSTQQSLDIERVKSVFPYGQILNIEVVDGGMICSSGVCLEAMGDKNDDCYIVNAAVVIRGVEHHMLIKIKKIYTATSYNQAQKAPNELVYPLHEAAANVVYDGLHVRSQLLIVVTYFRDLNQWFSVHKRGNIQEERHQSKRTDES